MKEIKYIKAWALFFLVATVGGFLAGAIVGGIAGFGIGLTNAGNPERIASFTPLFQALGFIVALPVSFYTFKWSISRFIIPQILISENNPPRDDNLG